MARKYFKQEELKTTRINKLHSGKRQEDGHSQKARWEFYREDHTGLETSRVALDWKTMASQDYLEVDC